MKTTLAFILSAVAAASAGTMVSAKEINMPAEQIRWRESSLPGYQKAVQQCMFCHSAHYAEYQPRTSGRNFWEAQVKRMKTVFNAPLPDSDIADITDYLYATYSTEKPKAEATKPAATGK